MREGVWTHTFGDAGLTCRVRHRLLDNRFVKVETSRWSPSGICTHSRGRKHELPGPLRGRVRALAVKGEREDDAAESSREIRLMLPFDYLQVSRQWLDDRCR